MAEIKVTGGDFIDHPQAGYANGVFRLVERQGDQLKRSYLSVADDLVDIRSRKDDPVSPFTTGIGGALRWAVVGAILGGVPGAVGGAILGASASVKTAKRVNRAVKGGQQSFVAKFRHGYRLEGEMDPRAIAHARLRLLRRD